jgi:DNA-binding NtrC family response regulator
LRGYAMKNRVLLVDDEANILNSYRRNLRGLVDFDLASSGQEYTVDHIHRISG